MSGPNYNVPLHDRIGALKYAPSRKLGTQVKVVISTDEYTIYQKRNDRYAVTDTNKNWVNGDEKIKILLEHALIETALPKAPVEEAEAPAEEAEVPAEDAPENEATTATDDDKDPNSEEKKSDQ